MPGMNRLTENHLRELMNRLGPGASWSALARRTGWSATNLQRFGEARGIYLARGLSSPGPQSPRAGSDRLGPLGSGSITESSGTVFDPRVGRETDPKEILRRIELRGRLEQLKVELSEAEPDGAAQWLIEFHQTTELVGYMDRNFPQLELPTLAELQERAVELLQKIDPAIELFCSYDAAGASLKEVETQVAQLKTQVGDLQSRKSLAQELEVVRQAHASTRIELQERSEEGERLSSRLATSEREVSSHRLRIAELEEAGTRYQRLLEERLAQIAELQHQLGLAKGDPHAELTELERIKRKLDQMDASDRERHESYARELETLRRKDGEREQAFLRLVDIQRHRGGRPFFLDDFRDEVALKFILGPYPDVANALGSGPST